MKRISSNMKSILKKTMYGCLALGCVLTMAACSNTSGGSDSGSTTVASYTAEDMPTVNRVMLKLEEKTGSNSHGYDGQVTDLSGDKRLRLLSKTEIKAMLDATDPEKTWPETFYETTPKITAPYNSGKLTKAALQSGLDRVNVIRRLMGVHPVELEVNYTRASQIGTLLHAITETSGHGVAKKPEGMEDSVFTEGNTALGKGNTANNNLPVSADEWLDDRGQPGNPMHRVWMTSPKAGKFGFGYVEKNTSNRGAAAPVQTGYSFLRACDQCANMGELYNNDWDFVAWPAPGYCPIGLWPETHVADNSGPNPIWTSPWSIQFPGMSSCKVTLTRTREGAEEKKWMVSYSPDTNISGQQSALVASPANGEHPIDKIYYHPISATANNGPGATAVTVLSFYPNEIDHTYEDGDVYNVTVEYGGTGTLAKKYSYDVTFFDPAQVQ